MASLLSPRQLRSRLSLQATEPTDDAAAGTGPGGDVPAVGWLTAVGGALVIALAGWVLVAGLSVLGWLTSEPGTLGEALLVGTELWLLANGGGTQAGGLTITLVPWGFVLLIGFLVARAAGFAARQLPRASGAGPSGAGVLSVAVMMTVAYLAPLMATALLLGQPLPAVRGAAVMAPIVAAAAAWGAGRAGGYRPIDRLPAWARPLPRAVLAAQLVLVATGTAALVTAAVQNLSGIERLVDALDAGLTGNVALLVLQLAFAPNLVVWAASYALGAGFSLGAAGLVAPAGTELGVLPGIPIFGALPAPGAAEPTSLWWLAGGVLAGAVAATVTVLARPGARFDETSLVGGLAGVLAGATFTAVAWLSSGDLGVARLVDLGPRLVPLLVLACTTLGLAGVGTGLALGLTRLVRRRIRARRTAKPSAPDGKV